MSSPKCPRCGFASWVNASACKRCGAAVCHAGAAVRPAAPGNHYAYAPAAPPKPGWVGVGLFGVRNRRGALAWLAGSLVVAASFFSGVYYLMAAVVEAPAHVALAFALPSGGLCLFSTLWYWLAIRWMDAHDAWPARR